MTATEQIGSLMWACQINGDTAEMDGGSNVTAIVQLSLPESLMLAFATVKWYHRAHLSPTKTKGIPK